MLICAIIWVTWSYVLATLSLILYGNGEPLSDLSQQVCIAIIATILAYCGKSYWENKDIAKNNLEYFKINNTIIGDDDEEEPKG